MEQQAIYKTRAVSKQFRRQAAATVARAESKTLTARLERIVQNRGIVFQSAAEKHHALWLEEERAAGRVRRWVHASEMPCFKLEVRGKLISTHKVDFLVRLFGGRKEVHGVKCGKGTENEADRIRVKLFRALNPNLPYRTFQVGGWSNRPVEYQYA